MSACLQDMQLQCPRHAIAVGGIRSAAVRNIPLQNILSRADDRARRVVEEQLLLLGCHLPKEIARLLPVIILQAMVIVTSVAVERERHLTLFRLAVPYSLPIPLITR